MARPRNSKAKPTIGITMGDPAGVGPEVVLKALHDRDVRSLGRFVIYGCNEIMAYAADQLEIEPYWFRVQHDSRRTSRQITEAVVVLDFDEFDGFMQSPRQPTRAGGLASRAFVEEAITDALRPSDDPRHVDALVTGPISKEGWHLAGFHWPGHTELLAHRTKAKRHVMMFVSPRLRV
ncbi:MAG: 4-hydroxythreonine-4-phosphate dehydrogenase PdxA, partial [Chloroflexi bacterium]|nr:4-hydroxythreonine-4-phosphate dehydrogenase PdxA [Chloroflexota bacterium]